MRKGIVIFLAVMMLFASALAETTQKAPDYTMEGYDGEFSGRNWETNLFFSRMQERTGISFQFSQHTDQEKWTERKKEILRGENMPDVLFKAELTGAETRDLYEAGRIIDLAPYLEEYAPDLWKLLEGNPEWKKAITLPDGSIPALPSFNELQNNDAMWINTTWLKKLNLEMPKTAEELTEVLRAFKEKDPNGNYQKDEVPLTFIGMWELRFLGHAFGIIDNDYYVTAKEGKVNSSLTSDENRAFLTWLHTLWDEGLLDATGFSTTDSIRQITDEKKAIPYGMLLSSSPLTVVPMAAIGQFSLMEPMTWDGKKVYRDLLGDMIRGTFAISSACRDPEKLVSWVNLLYTEEISRLAHFGKEGEDYIMTEGGYWEWNADAQTAGEVILPESTISEGGVAPGLTDADFQLRYSDEATRNNIEQLSALRAFCVKPFPQVFLKAEDEKRIAEIQKNLSGYAEKAMACFVTGDTELTDENWAEFCRTVDEKGLSEMVAIWQKYVD
jgi:putative aldouronate transport system substrate-binding protein